MTYASGIHNERARRLLEENGYPDLADWVGRLEMGESEFLGWLAERGLPIRREVAQQPPVEPVGSDPLSLLVDDAGPEVALRVAAGRLIGRCGSVKLSAGLRLLLTALQANGRPVGHGYTLASAERVLRSARSALVAVDRRLAPKMAVPVVGPGTVAAVFREPVWLRVEGLGGEEIQ